MPDNVIQLKAMLDHCCMCPRDCCVDRTAGQLGACQTGITASVSSAMRHFGEESVLVGSGGSGTIFFSRCNLHCVFCQNHDISQRSSGRACSPEQIAAQALELAQAGCENINFVTPTHVSHAVAEAIIIARTKGLTVPTVYNCGGYESVATLELLEGLIDIYMPDFKYAWADAGLKYSGVKDYPRFATEALREMYRQRGPLQTDNQGIATKGVLIRHLVMPNDIAQSENVIEIVAQNAPGSAINIMAQYRPAYRAGEFPELMDYPSDKIISSLRSAASSAGLECL
ncbi:MAG: radical SAM protein [Sedimentisphaerales bacterium]|nr:radical SAM protein [Sedimentisphaerales bacterium]